MYKYGFSISFRTPLCTSLQSIDLLAVKKNEITRKVSSTNTWMKTKEEKENRMIMERLTKSKLSTIQKLT